MGCDIHFVVEQRVGKKWVGLFSKWPRPEGALAGWRDYAVFAALAGVRNYEDKVCPEPRGVPEDASKLARVQINEWGCDGHSHSWMTLREFADVFVATRPEKFESEWQKKNPWDKLFGSCAVDCDDESDAEKKYRVVFWFDN